MSKRDTIHEAVRNALEKDGWTITHDPLIIPSGGTTFRIDLGAEKVIIAQRGSKKIAVEVKSLAKISLIHDFYEAFGQYMFYRDAFSDESIDRTVYLAVSPASWKRIQTLPFIVKRLDQYKIKVVIVNVVEQIIVEWKE